jgi:proteic killer suppression protein
VDHVLKSFQSRLPNLSVKLVFLGKNNLFDWLTTITRYVIMLLMIKSFADKETEKLFNRTFSKKVPESIHIIARMKLEIIDAADSIQDLRIPPGNHLEKLSGNREGQYSIRINNQWRICFVWKEENAYRVEIVDYH